ncbi:MAG: EAL domain-containing protein [Silvibacterium sp.]|nr:EAL domain-containing protein [Silvibacterium sp.]MBV8436964.1 EAL domain-containing protein [Silvibacterium sp.]
MVTELDEKTSDQRFRLAVEASLDGFWQVELSANVAHFSQRWQAIAGFEPREHTATLEHWIERVHPDDRPRFETELRALSAGKSQRMRNEHRLRDRLGLWRWVSVRGLAERTPLDGHNDGRSQVVRIAGSMTDQTERRMTDPLTGLPNREFFIEHLERRLEQARVEGDWAFAVLSVAIERFKMVNESLGYHGGDALLLEAASRLTEATAQRLTSESVIARLSGAEFLVCLEGVASEQEAIGVASDIYVTLRKPFQWRSQRVAPSAAMGIAKADESYLHPDELMRDADAAITEAKTLGRGRLVCYSSGMRERAVARLKMEADLEQAIRSGELVLHYQPEIDLATRTIAGFEALVRWRHPERGLIPPGEFIPLAEESGLILPLGDWGLTEACRQIAAWRALSPKGGPPLRVSVNLSATQFGRPGLAEHIAAVLATTSLSADNLRLEVTESSLMSNPETALETMQDLKSLGVGLHMDDFGTGYSSLNHLHSYPFDTLKIDRSFIQGMGGKQDSVEIVGTILDLARSLGMDVVAEGIETAEQAERLTSLGCRLGQGYYFFRPMDAATIGAMLMAADNQGCRLPKIASVN